MTTQHYYFSAESGEIIVKDKADPAQGGVHFTTPEELAASPISTADLLKWVNSDKKGEERVKRFSDRLSGARRIFKELGHLTDDEQDAAQAEADKRGAAAPVVQGDSAASAAAQPPAEASAASEQASSTTRGGGRRSGYAGKRVFHSVIGDTTGETPNPRKAGSYGFRSLQLLIDAGTEGLAYEDYIAGGGRPQDLAWDIGKGYARAGE